MSKVFPMLARIAFDIIFIPYMLAELERIFSG